MSTVLQKQLRMRGIIINMIGSHIMPATKIYNKLLHNFLIKLQVHHLIQHIHIHVDICSKFSQHTMQYLFPIHFNYRFDVIHVEYILAVAQLGNFLVLAVLLVVLVMVGEFDDALGEDCADAGDEFLLFLLQGK